MELSVKPGVGTTKVEQQLLLRAAQSEGNVCIRAPRVRGAGLLGRFVWRLCQCRFRMG
jgi:hypothetical protein